MAGTRGHSGRKKTPTEVLKFRGTYRPDLRPDNELKPDAEVPNPPDAVKGEALKEWKRITKIMVKYDLVTLLDRAALTAYCLEWANYLKLAKYLNNIRRLTTTTDKGNVIQHPLVGQRNRHFSNLLQICREFGLTPSARASLNIQKPNEVSDPLAELLKRNAERRAGGAAG